MGGPLTLYAVPVQYGSFNTQADFGPLTNVQNAWLAVSVKTAGSSEFSDLGARAPVSADATAATGSVCPGAWTLAGNAGNPAGSYIGTADNNPLFFKVDGNFIGQLSSSGDPNVPDAPNVVFGSWTNSVESAAGGTIAGGGRPVSYCGLNGTSDCRNFIEAVDYGTIGGGRGNYVGGYAATISGGGDNIVNANYSTVGGGITNNVGANAYSSTISGGEKNAVTGNDSIIGGGTNNNVAGNEATVGGGESPPPFPEQFR